MKLIDKKCDSCGKVCKCASGYIDDDYDLAETLVSEDGRRLVICKDCLNHFRNHTSDYGNFLKEKEFC